METELDFDPSLPQTCYICLEEVYPKQKGDIEKYCATCKNGHYVHRKCASQLVSSRGRLGLPHLW